LVIALGIEAVIEPAIESQNRWKPMRAVVQRVSRAAVSVDGQISGEIGAGLLVLLGVGQEDTEADATYLAEKICGLRIFEDDDGKMNRSVKDVGGGVLAVSRSRSSLCTETCAAASGHRSMPSLRRNRLGGGMSFLSSAFAPLECVAKPDASRK
jgi:D-Tyr-tRNA(Tyr) deacylase